MNINIKKANDNELSKANKLLTKLIQDETKYDENLRKDLIIEKYYEHKKNNSIIFFAYDNEVIVGYIYGFIIDDTSLKSPSAKLDALYVLEKYRGSGAATKLVDKFISWCTNNNILFISTTVLSDNLVAKHLYMKHGFLPRKEELFIGYKPKTYGKLVRDKIPDKIQSNGEIPITRILDLKEYKLELEKKLYEEYLEVLNSSKEDRLEELADMLEVLENLAKCDNYTLEDILLKKKEKKNKRGSFEDRIYLIRAKKN